VVLYVPGEMEGYAATIATAVDASLIEMWKTYMKAGVYRSWSCCCRASIMLVIMPAA
jgi:hypothetical protein